MKLGIDIVSDVICPWCFIGKRRFEKALRLLPEEIQIDVRWRPFELNPDMPSEGISRELYRTRKFGSWERSRALDAQVAEHGAGEGIRFAFDRMERTPNTLEAHRLIWLAGEQGVQGAVVEGLFQAYFVHARDVGNRDVLTQIAATSGMDTFDFLESERGREEVRAEASRSRQQGIDGVPFFLIGGTTAISGAQQPETIAATLTRAMEAGFTNL
jgi:predicted DsbA family dithiol-disulfide isomerase